MCRNHRIKRMVPCRCRTGTLKKPAKCLWRWEPDRRSNFFSPPAHLCRHIYNWNIVRCVVGEVNWLFNVTMNDISVIYVTAHRCAGGQKKLGLRPGSQRHRHFVGFFNVPVLAPTREYPFYTVIPTHRPIKSPFTITLGIRRTHSPHGSRCVVKHQ